jgi:hypothetical protein
LQVLLAIQHEASRRIAADPGRTLVRLRKLGADADGETGEAPALRAIGEVLAKHPADEIILATAPHRMTRLLAMDLPHRVHPSSGLPVTVLGTARTES